MDEGIVLLLSLRFVHFFDPLNLTAGGSGLCVGLLAGDRPVAGQDLCHQSRGHASRNPRYGCPPSDSNSQSKKSRRSVTLVFVFFKSSWR